MKGGEIMKNKQNKKGNKSTPLKLTNCLIENVRICKNGKIILTILPYFKKK